MSAIQLFIHQLSFFIWRLFGQLAGEQRLKDGVWFSEAQGKNLKILFLFYYLSGQAGLINFNAKCCFDVVSWRLGKYPSAANDKKESGVLLLDSSMWRVRILVTRTLRRLGLFPSFPETVVKTTSFHKHDLLHRGHSSFSGFAYSKISEDLSSNRGACDVITQPHRWRELGICAEEKHSRPVQGARGTFGAVFIPCIG